jgi:tetratricopeptide (TPR) repeat protein
MAEFSTDGFDLDAIAAGDGSGDDNVVFEIGGGATITRDDPSPDTGTKEGTAIDIAENWKQQGNEQFKQGSYLEAYDLYTEAAEACPGQLKGPEILKLRDEFELSARETAYNRHRLAEEERRKLEKDKSEKPPEVASSSSEKPEEFQLPPQECGDKLATYYCNRAAALLHMNRLDDAIKDCDVAVLLDPKYSKAFVRRSVAHEKLEQTEDALGDAKKALELDPTNATLKKTVARLQKMEDERLEKLKDETLGEIRISCGLTACTGFRFVRLADFLFSWFHCRQTEGFG